MVKCRRAMMVRSDLGEIRTAAAAALDPLIKTRLSGGQLLYQLSYEV
jgi:hypothetical protein